MTTVGPIVAHFPNSATENHFTDVHVNLPFSLYGFLLLPVLAAQIQACDQSLQQRVAFCAYNEAAFFRISRSGKQEKTHKKSNKMGGELAVTSNNLTK